MISQFFIHRPIFAMAIALVFMLIGGLSYASLPREQYPNITPPTVTVTTTFLGANAQQVAENVAVPIEESINGVSNMLYMQSESTASGQYSLTVTFALGTNPDLDTVAVQNRVSQAAGTLPPVVNTVGVIVRKASSNFLMGFALYSPHDTYDTVYMNNYAAIHIVDPLLRVNGVGTTLLFPQQDYAVRAWLRPDALAALQLTTGDISNAIQTQSVVAPGGTLNAPPVAKDNAASFQYTINAPGQLSAADQFGQMVVRTTSNGNIIRLRDVARTEIGAQDYSAFGLHNQHPSAIVLLLQSPGTNALRASQEARRVMAGLATQFPPGLTYNVAFDSTTFVSAALSDVVRTWSCRSSSCCWSCSSSSATCGRR